MEKKEDSGSRDLESLLADLLVALRVQQMAKRQNDEPDFFGAGFVSSPPPASGVAPSLFLSVSFVLGNDLSKNFGKATRCLGEGTLDRSAGSSTTLFASLSDGQDDGTCSLLQFSRKISSFHQAPEGYTKKMI